MEHRLKILQMYGIKQEVFDGMGIGVSQPLLKNDVVGKYFLEQIYKLLDEWKHRLINFSTNIETRTYKTTSEVND